MLTRWLMALAKADSLREENRELKIRYTDLEHRLFAEIDGNRRREAALLEQVIAASRQPAQQQIPVPRHTELTKSPADEPDVTFAEMALEAPEDLVRQRATEMYEQAQANGFDYGPEGYEVLCQKIRDNPEYLDN
jgi:hypothetical protein